jgi:hypothetical protein
MTASSKTESDKKASKPKEDRSIADLFEAYLEDVPLMDDEDDVVFRQSVDAVAKETRVTSFLGLIAAKELVEKLHEEQRLKSARIEIMQGARQRVASYADQAEQELEASSIYLEKFSKIDRVITNSQAGRRALLKELRQHGSNDAPPLVPED